MNTPEQADTRIGYDFSEKGLDFIKYVFEAAERADKFMFEITKANLLAFGALGAFSTTGLFPDSFSRQQVILTFCVIITAISIGSACLAFFYYRHSNWLYARAWIIEKAWLKGWKGRDLVEELRNENTAFMTKAEFRKAKLTNPQLKMPIKFYSWNRVGFYAVANLMPAFVSSVVFVLVITGVLSLHPAH